MYNDGNYIKVRYNVNINDDRIFVVTNNKEVLLTKENAKKMSKILNKYKAKKLNTFTYVYEDYDKIMNDFFSSKRTRKVNRRKSKRIVLGVISGVMVTLLVSGVFSHIKNKNEKEELITYAVTFNDDSIEIPEEDVLDNSDKVEEENSNIDVDVTISDVNGDNNNFDVDVSVDTEESKEDIKEVVETKENIHEFNYDFSGDYDFDTVINSKQYMDLYEKYGNMYGIAPNLLLLIGAQENRGMHSTDTSGSATGVMQIEDWWLGKSFEVYNFEKGDYETVYVDPNKITNLEDNIKYGACLFRYCVDYAEKKVNKGYITENEFLPFVVQTYNMGETNMNRILDTNGWWFDNRNYIEAGDSKYIEHVFCEAPNDVIYKFKTVDGMEYSAKVENLNDWIYSNAPSGYGL